LLGKLSQVPVAEEFFTKATFAVLKKPEACRIEKSPSYHETHSADINAR
jgi:hypothetical protein